MRIATAVVAIAALSASPRGPETLANNEAAAWRSVTLLAGEFAPPSVGMACDVDCGREGWCDGFWHTTWNGEDGMYGHNGTCMNTGSGCNYHYCGGETLWDEHVRYLVHAADGGDQAALRELLSVFPDRATYDAELDVVTVASACPTDDGALAVLPMGERRRTAVADLIVTAIEPGAK